MVIMFCIRYLTEYGMLAGIVPGRDWKRRSQLARMSAFTMLAVYCVARAV